MTTQTPIGALHRLKDSDLRLAGPKSDIRGYKVVDREDEEIGKVDDLLVDEREQKVRFVEVEAGGLLGLGKERFLLPVESIGEIRDDFVRLNQARERVSGAPKYDPDLVEQPYLSELYGYYGYRTPFWDTAYVYPRYPYF
jgi:sporulation protein YlmC with PRC-barrel domain